MIIFVFVIPMSMLTPTASPVNAIKRSPTVITVGSTVRV